MGKEHEQPAGQRPGRKSQPEVPAVRETAWQEKYLKDAEWNKEAFERRLAADMEKPFFHHLLDEIDPKQWGWDNMAEWLLDYANLVEQRPEHMGRIRFRPKFANQFHFTEEGKREPRTKREQEVEKQYRQKVKFVVQMWRLDGKL